MSNRAAYAADTRFSHRAARAPRGDIFTWWFFERATSLQFPHYRCLFKTVYIKFKSFSVWFIIGCFVKVQG